MTPSLHELQELTDDALSTQLHRHARREGHAVAAVVAHISEFDYRKLYLPQACSSMVAYCQRVLGYSESAAFRRIEAGRVVRRFPELLGRLHDGRLHLTALRLLAPHLTGENWRTLAAAAEGRTKAEIEALVAPFRTPHPAAPRPVIRPMLVARPRHRGRGTAGAPAPSTGPPDAAGHEVTSDPGALDLFSHQCSPEDPAERAGAAVVSGGTPEGAPSGTPEGAPGGTPEGARGGTPGATPGGEPSLTDLLASGEAELEYRLSVTISAAVRAKLERACELSRHQIPRGDLGELLGRALDLYIEKLEAAQFGRVRKPRGVRGHASAGREKGRLSESAAAGEALMAGAAGSAAGRAVMTGSAVAPADLGAPGVVAATPAPEAPAVPGAAPPAPEGPAFPGAAPPAPQVPAARLPSAPLGTTDRPSRTIPAAVRRQVAARDSMQCAYVGVGGRRCTERSGLEYHHVRPHARGGPTTPENLILLCPAHHRMVTEEQFGPHGVRDAAQGATRRSGATRPGASWLPGNAGPEVHGTG